MSNQLYKYTILYLPDDKDHLARYDPEYPWMANYLAENAEHALEQFHDEQPDVVPVGVAVAVIQGSPYTHPLEGDF